MAFGTTNLQGSPQALGATFYNKTIDNSLRMGDAQNSTLQWAAGTPSSTSIWTMSFWIKFWDPEAGQAATEFFSAGTSGSAYSFFGLNASSNFIHETELPGARNKAWNRVIRDPSSWYHFVLRADLNQTVQADRLKWYVNGVLQTDTSTDGITQSTWSFINTNSVTQNWGGKTSIANANPGCDVYLAEINFCDGQSYGPEKFGEDKNGVWIPREPNVTYGNNGYRLEFKQTGVGGASATTVGADTSGRGNHFTDSGIAATDITPDTPTENFCTLNQITAGTSFPTLKNGSLEIATVYGADLCGVASTMYPETGKWYWEVFNDNAATTYPYLGITDQFTTLSSGVNNGSYYAVAWSRNGNGEQLASTLGTITEASVSTWTTNDIIMFALDCDAKKLWIGKNGTWEGSADPTAGTNQNASWTIQAPVSPMIMGYSSQGVGCVFNFGADASFAGHLTGGNVGSAIGGGGTFKYAPPSGFKALKASNFEEPVSSPRNDSIDNSFFYTTLYEGNGAGQRVGQFLPLNEIKTVNNSIIFNDDDSPSLAITYGSDGTSQALGTFSWWMKRGNLGDSQENIYFENSGYGGIQLRSDKLAVNSFDSSDAQVIVQTDVVLRDTTSWYHCVVSVNGTAGTIKFYINGAEQVQTVATGSLASSRSWDFLSHDSRRTFGIGAAGGNASVDAYLADFHYIDGQALDASYFGQTDTSTEKWIPKTYSGSHGTNGFHLEFLDSSAVGADSAGTNTFTPANIDGTNLTIDTPTKLFATFDQNRPSGTALTFSEGNLKVERTSSQFAQAYSNLPNGGITFGKWYAEFILDTGNHGVGVIAGDTVPGTNRYMGQDSYTYGYYADGRKVNSGSYTSYGDAYSVAADGSGDVVGVLINADDGEISFSKNGTVQNSGTPAFSDLTGPFRFAISSESNCFHVANFGQDSKFAGLRQQAANTDGFSSADFKYTPPAGYKSLNVDNFPDQTRDVRRRKVPVWTWIKNRDAADSSILVDQVRGAGVIMHSDDTPAETTEVNTLQKFLAGGFQVGNDDQVNTNGESYVAWNWCMHDDVVNAGVQTISPAGSIAATGLVDRKLGWSVLTYTGTGSAATVGHGLRQAPDLIIAKRRNAIDGWLVYHSSRGENAYLYLNTDGAGETSVAYPWNGTAPTNSVFSVNSAASPTSSGTMIAYCFHAVPGFSAMGTYKGNGDNNGVYVPLGFKPAWILIKKLGAGQWWGIYDNTRDPDNLVKQRLWASHANVEDTYSTDQMDFVADGVKMRGSYDSINGTGSTYIYWAMADSPFNFSNAR